MAPICPVNTANTIADPEVGMSLAKSGRTTGLSCSTVSDVSAVNVYMRAECGNPTEISVRFSDQMIPAQLRQLWRFRVFDGLRRNCSPTRSCGEFDHRRLLYCC